jgi:hypothetical protein
MIEFALRQAANIRWQVLDINKDARARRANWSGINCGYNLPKG